MSTEALDLELVRDIARFHNDPEGFADYAWPWGEADTELAEVPGPRKWQRAKLRLIGEKLREGATAQEAIQMAIASGHGIGKSAFIAMVLCWALATREDTRAVVTANTEGQLRTKTWPELMKWHRLLICRHWFECTATAMYSLQPGHDKSWRVDAVAWSETNTEAFAGLHNKGRRIVLVFDEGSAIPDPIWEVSEGALTDENTQIIWLAFGNPTRTATRFHACFGRLRHRWLTDNIDSREVEGTNKAQLDAWVADYGEDSDFVRIRVRGVFPRAGSTQFIGTDLIEEAQRRPVFEDRGAPLVMGVDIARFGDDQCVIRFRQGRDGKTLTPIKWRDRDTHFSANKIAEAIKTFQPKAVFIDGGGVGAGVVDMLKAWHFHVIEVNFGAAAGETKKYFNKRAEMWAAVRDWLPTGSIDDDRELETDLAGPEYGFDKEGRIQLEKKEDMKKRGVASPDDGDALALTFAGPVARLDLAASLHAARNAVAVTDYPMFG